MRAMFVLDEVARAEEIEVSPFDVHQEVEKLAASMGPCPSIPPDVPRC